MVAVRVYVVGEYEYVSVVAGIVSVSVVVYPGVVVVTVNGTHVRTALPELTELEELEELLELLEEDVDCELLDVDCEELDDWEPDELELECEDED